MSAQKKKVHNLLLSILIESSIGYDSIHAAKWINCHDDVTNVLRGAALESDLEAVTARFQRDIMHLINPDRSKQMVAGICAIIIEDNKITFTIFFLKVK